MLLYDMYLTQPCVAWSHDTPEPALINLNFTKAALSVHGEALSRGSDGRIKHVTASAVDLTRDEVLEACGSLNEYFRNTLRDTSAAVLCVDSKPAAIPKNLEFIVIPIRNKQGVWYVFAYQAVRRLLFVSNSRVDYETVTAVLALLEEYTAAEDTQFGVAETSLGDTNRHVGDLISLNCDNTNNSGACSVAMVMALLKNWNMEHTMSDCVFNLADYLVVEEDTSQVTVSCHGREHAYTDVLTCVLRAALCGGRGTPTRSAKSSRPTRGPPATSQLCRYNDVFFLV
jgi:hypothetical protein